MPYGVFINIWCMKRRFYSVEKEELGGGELNASPFLAERLEEKIRLRNREIGPDNRTIVANSTVRTAVPYCTHR